MINFICELLKWTTALYLLYTKIMLSSNIKCDQEFNASELKAFQKLFKKIYYKKTYITQVIMHNCMQLNLASILTQTI